VNAEQILNNTRSNFSLSRYFCRTCWQFQHNSDPSLRNHKPLTRNSKSTTIIGVGPQQSAASTPTSPTEPGQQHPMLSAAFNKQFQQQQYQQSNVV
jgi:cytoplasmic polyadenylation element-binding protein